MGNSKMQNMAVRALSGAVYVALIVCSLLAKPAWFTALMAVFALLAVVELEKLLSERAKISVAALACDAIMAVCMALSAINHNFLIAVVLYLPVRIILAVSDKSTTAAKAASFSMLAVLYTAMPLAMLAWINYACQPSIFYNTRVHLVLFTFVMIWVNDTGAYLSGMTFGRHKMCERLSPKKTWEGFWGGFAFCVAIGIIVGLWLSPAGSVLSWAIYAAAVSVVGTYGDLFESLIKRTLGVKDSGHLIPGHGGILDRIDSILAVAPLTIIFWFLGL